MDESRRFRRTVHDFFLLLRLINTLTYLLTDEFLLINIYGSSMEKHVQSTWHELKFY